MIRQALNRSHERWANLHPVMRFLALGTLLAGIGFIAAKPGYRMFKAWRIERNLASAREAVAENRMNDARDLSLAVLRAGDPGIEAYRILEKSTASLRDPRHDDIARALMTHPESSREDRLRGFRSVAADMPLGVVGQAWVSLGVALQKTPDFAAIFGRRLIEEKHFNEAAKVLLGVPEKPRAGEVGRGLARVLIGSGRKEGFDEAQRLISAGIAADGADLESWLGVMERIPALALRENLLEPVRERLEAVPTGDPARQALALARIDYAAHYARRAEILEETVARWKNTAPLALARFLNDLGLYRMALDGFPPARVNAHAGLCPMLILAAEREGDWDRVPGLLDTPGNPMSKLEKLAHRAVLAAHTEDAASLAKAWDAAMAEAAGTPAGNAFLTLHRIASEAGMTDQAQAAMIEAIRLGRGPLPLYVDLKTLMIALRQQGHENLLLEISAIYLKFEPGNPVLLTQYSYLACLNDLADPATILKTIEPLAGKLPGQVPVQCVLAALHLFAGQPVKAADLLTPLKLDPAQLPPSFRVVLLASRILNGRMTPDDPLVRNFPWNSLLPSERRKFSGLIRDAQRKMGG